jgi:polyphosphate kinase 2 (PPK2 family)
MLDDILQEEELSKEEYSAKLEQVEPQLFYLEWKAREAKMPTLILLDGMFGTYMSEAIQTLTERLDPRSLRVYRFQEATPHEKKFPWLWRFWQKLPNHGEMALFDRSWHQQIIADSSTGDMKSKELSARIEEANQLERTLLDDGHVLLKFWFHIGRKDQEKRLKKADKETDDFWDVTEAEWEQNREYKRWKKVASEVITATNNERAPWVLLDSVTPRRNRIKLFESIIAHMQDRLAIVMPGQERGPAPKKQDIELAIDASVDKRSNG